MRIHIQILLLSIPGALFSCNNSVKNQDITAIAESTHTIPVDTVSKQPDTWIYDSLVKRNHSLYEERTIEIEKNVRLSDSVFYVLYSVGTPVNRIEYILSYIHNKPQKEFLIGEGPDADYSIPYYDYTEYLSDNDTLYTVFHYDQRVKYPEKVLDKEGHFKEGFDFDNVDIKTDTVITQVRLRSTGKVIVDSVRSH